DANPAWHAERLERAERSILEREWLAVRRREDLELSDLVPLPEFPVFPSRIPPEDLGTAFQLYEFFHVFGNQLNLQVHSYEHIRGRRVQENPPLTLSWSALEAALVESNPCGPLADILVRLLCTIRRFDAEANTRQVAPSVLAATHAAAAAVAAAERGSSLALYTIGHASDYGTLYEELTTGPDANNYLRVLRDAAVATRINELVGIPIPTVSQAAGKAAIVVASAEDPAEKGAIKEDQFQPIPNRNSNARAVTMATLAGATSLCPLDRIGLTKALWLHLVGAVARVGGWRGQIWGGARPLDDPAVMLARDHPSLLEKLNEVSVYELATHEKLLLLTCLMDQLALYPQLRDRLEEQFERQRLLRTRLRALRTDSSVDESVSESTNIGMHRVKSTNRGGRATGQAGCGACDKPVGPKPSSQISNLDKMDDFPRTSDSYSTPSTTNCTTTATTSITDSSITANAEPSVTSSTVSERQLWDSIFEASRGCSMLPLGQDRFCRRYWLILSLPCILIEDAPSPTDPVNTTPVIPNRQFSSFYPECAERLGLSSCTAAGRRLRDFVLSLPYKDADDRDYVTYQLASRLREGDNAPAYTTEQLRMLVKPDRVQVKELAQQNSGPVFDHLQSIISHRSTDSRSCRTRWYIIRPTEEPVPVLLPTKSAQQKSDCVQEVAETKPDISQTLTKLSSDDESCVSRVDIAEDGKSPTAHRPASTDATSLTASDITYSNVNPMIMERASWTLDCLEASLNARGVRESRLRKTIGQLRPLLIRVIASCSPTAESPFYWEQQTAVDTTRASSSTCSTKQSVSTKQAPATLLAWLEIALRRLAARLRLSSVIRSMLLSHIDDTKRDQHNGIKPEEDEESVFSHGRISDNTESSARPPLSTSTLEPQKRLGLLARALLALGRAIGPKCVSGPISNDSRTLRGGGFIQSNSSIDGRESSPSLPRSNRPTTLNNQPVRTTGWQRWCAHVQSARSPSELHLLARALERGVRRAALVRGRGFHRWTTDSDSKHALPKLRCTACTWPPDPQPSNSLGNSAQLPRHAAVQSGPRGSYIPFSVCAGCSAPFHLDCLLNSRSRVRRNSLRQLNRPRPSEIPVLHDLSETDLRMTGYCSLSSPLSSITAARMETAGASLYLCNSCLRVSGHLSSDMSVSPSNCIEDHLTGDEDWESISGDSSSSNEDDVEDVQREDVAAFPQRESKRERPAKLRSPESIRCRQSFSPTRIQSVVPRKLIGKHRSLRHNRRGRPFKSRRLSPHRLGVRGSGTCPSLCPTDSSSSSNSETRKRGRGRPKVIKPVDLCAPVEKRNAPTAAEKMKANPEAIHNEEFDSIMLNGIDCIWDANTVIKFPNIGCLKRATVVLAPCDLVETSQRTSSPESPRPVGRPSRKSITSPTSADVNSTDVSLSKSEFSQQFTEKLFAELCSSSSARPLLRCGLGRTVALAELTDNESNSPGNSPLVDSIHPRRTCRTSLSAHRGPMRTDCTVRRSHSNRLYAWDLAGLRDLLVRNQLPGGPREAVEQLRLLLKHWLHTNRPGSRLHQCALDVSHQLDLKLGSVSSTSSPVPPAKVARRTARGSPD
ncbi:hypothetical protein PHET_06321, partial [Paragonimus heterotremus]